jgi:hypothetical protein
MEYEAVVVKLSSSEALRVLHELERFNPLTYRGGNTRIRGRGRPYSETSRNQSGGNGKQTCRGRHEMFDFEPFVMRGFRP